MTPYNIIIIVKMSQLMMCHVMWHSIWIFCNVEYCMRYVVSSVNCQMSGTNRNFLSGLDFTHKWLFEIHRKFLEKKVPSTFLTTKPTMLTETYADFLSSSSGSTPTLKQNKRHHIFSSDIKQKLQPMVSPTYF